MKINSIKNGKIEKTYQQKTNKTKNIAVIIYEKKKKKKVTSLFSLTLTKRPSGTGRKISTGRASKKCIL